MANHYNARVDNKVEYWIRDKLEDLENFDGIYIYLETYPFPSAYNLGLCGCWRYNCFAFSRDNMLLMITKSTCKS